MTSSCARSARWLSSPSKRRHVMMPCRSRARGWPGGLQRGSGSWRSWRAPRARKSDVADLAEAVAALQDLALTFAEDGSEAAHRLAEREGLEAGLSPRIQCVHNGPYLVTNVSRVVDWLGRPLSGRPQMALCRCGASAIKPLCDGSH